MKKTYVASLPDHVGTFLDASRRISALGINITRLSYNKAVDSRTLFLEVSGTAEQIEKADKLLSEIGYLMSDDSDSSIVLLEFRLKDEPGSALPILELIREFNFNISYMSSQENGTEYQLFKMGLFVESKEAIKEFLVLAEDICPVRVIDYNHTEKNFDNTIFYQSFANGLAKCMDMDNAGRDDLLIDINLVMHMLDERGLSPYRTFDNISRFAEHLAAHRGEAFSPRISEHRITENTVITLIEPPCGSNIAIIKSGEEYLFVDTGHACYKDEMLAIFRRLIPDFDNIHKRALITHADLDHCGLLPLFDQVDMSHKSRRCIEYEFNGEGGFREMNPLHKPYIRICKQLTGYKPMNPRKANVICGNDKRPLNILEPVGRYIFGDLNFEIYEGQGGHLPGEIVLIDYEHRLVFTGDIYLNIKGMTPEQASFNKYAPILMTSVDTEPNLCRDERNAILQRLGAGDWQIFGAHGMKKDYRLKLMD